MCGVGGNGKQTNVKIIMMFKDGGIKNISDVDSMAQRLTSICVNSSGFPRLFTDFRYNIPVFALFFHFFFLDIIVELLLFSNQLFI